MTKLPPVPKHDTKDKSMMPLYTHQKKIISDDPKKCVIGFGCGAGKSITALILARKKVLVICPKTIRDAKTWPLNQAKMLSMSRIDDLTILSKEEFRARHTTLTAYDTVIVDEFANGYSISTNVRTVKGVRKPKTSQLYDALDTYLAKHKPERLYLLSATIGKSAMCVYAAGVCIGRKWDHREWRDTFYKLIHIPGREIYLPDNRKEVQARLLLATQRLGYFGGIEDFFDMPEQTHLVRDVGLTPEQQKAIMMLPVAFPDPLVRAGKAHQLEQGLLMTKTDGVLFFKNNKFDALTELQQEFEKIIVFAEYTHQIQSICNHFFQKKIRTLTLTGATKNAAEVIAEANKQSEIVLIIQTSISEGYELPTFRCTVFAGEDRSWSKTEQAQGRTLRANALARNLYVYLVAGKIDKKRREAHERLTDFDDAMYVKAQYE